MPDYKLRIIVEAKDKASGPLSSVSKSLRRIGEFAAGTLVAQGITSIARATSGLAVEAIAAYSEFERLGMSLNSLTAREFLKTGEAETMAEALGMGSDKAEELLGWIEQLAIKSPFDQAGVAQAFRTTLAYGFAADEAQRLTQATIDYTAATGQQGITMRRIGLALGQIRAKGKLAGQEVLQLTEAGINVREILAEAFNVTTEELITMQEKGLLPAKEVIEAIISSMERDFGGAAAKQAETFAGLLESLGDLRAITLREFIAGSAQAIQPFLTQLVDTLSNPEIRQKIKDLGERVGESLGKSLSRIAKIVQSLSSRDIPSIFEALGFSPQSASTLQAVVRAFTPFIEMARTLGSFTFDTLGNLASGIQAVAESLASMAGGGDGVFGGFLETLATDGAAAAEKLGVFLGNLKQLQTIFIAGQENDLASAVSASFALPENWQTLADNVFNFSRKIKQGLDILGGLGKSFAAGFTGDTLAYLTAWTKLPEGWQQKAEQLNIFATKIKAAYTEIKALGTFAVLRVTASPLEWLRAYVELPEGMQGQAEKFSAFVDDVGKAWAKVAAVQAYIAAAQKGDSGAAVDAFGSLPEDIAPATTALNSFITAAKEFGKVTIPQLKADISLAVTESDGLKTAVEGIGESLLDAFDSTQWTDLQDKAGTFGSEIVAVVSTSLSTLQGGDLVLLETGAAAFALNAYEQVKTALSEAFNTKQELFDPISGQMLQVNVPIAEVLTGILADIQAEVDRVFGAESIESFFSNIETSLSNFEGVSATAELFNGWITGLIDAMSGFGAIQWEAYTAGITGIGNVLIAMMDSATTFVENVDAAEIGDAMGNYVAAMTEGLGTAVANAPIAEILTAMTDFLTTSISQLAVAIGNEENFAKLGTAAGSIITTLVDEIVKVISDADKRDEIYNAVTSLTAEFAEAADALARGFATKLGEFNWGLASGEITSFVIGFVKATFDGLRLAFVPEDDKDRYKEAFAKIQEAKDSGGILGGALEILAQNLIMVSENAKETNQTFEQHQGEMLQSLKDGTYEQENFFNSFWEGLTGASKDGASKTQNNTEGFFEEFFRGILEATATPVKAAASTEAAAAALNSFDQAMITAGANYAAQTERLQAMETELGTTTQGLIEQLATAREAMADPAQYEIMLPAFGVSDLQMEPIQAPKIDVETIEMPDIEPPNWDKYIKRLEWPLIVDFDWGRYVKRFRWPVLPVFRWSLFVPRLRWPPIKPPNWNEYIPGLKWPVISAPDWTKFIPSLVWGSSVTTAPIAASQYGRASWRGGLTTVGEAGPELLNLPRGSRIYSNARSRQLVAEQAAPVTVAVGPVYVNNDQDIDELAWKIAKRIETRRRR